MSETFRTIARLLGLSDAPDEAFIADMDRCMRGMKDCAWEYSGSSGLPIPKRGEVPWLDACMKRACE